MLDLIMLSFTEIEKQCCYTRTKNTTKKIFFTNLLHKILKSILYVGYFIVIVISVAMLSVLQKVLFI